MPNHRLKIVSGLAATALSAGMVFAQTLGSAPVAPAAKSAPAAANAPADPRAAIAKKIDGLKADDVRISPINGVYEIARGSQIGYASADGKYVILGDLIDIDSDNNLSEARRRNTPALVSQNSSAVFSRLPSAPISASAPVRSGFADLTSRSGRG